MDLEKQIKNHLHCPKCGRIIDKLEGHEDEIVYSQYYYIFLCDNCRILLVVYHSTQNRENKIFEFK